MIDIHSHIIHGVGDGPSSIEESLKMISEAEEMGVKAIFATPHLSDSAQQQKKISRNFKELADRLTDSNISLIPGYEICVNAGLSNKISQLVNQTLGNTKFVLLEFPVDTLPDYMHNIIYKLQVRGLTPIIAHPERNMELVRKPEAFLDLFARGCFIQVNAASIAGVYGRQRKAFVKKLIKKDMVHFVGSDAHNTGDYNRWYLRAYHKVLRWSGAEYTDRLFYKNPAMILEDTKLALRCGL